MIASEFLEKYNISDNTVFSTHEEAHKLSHLLDGFLKESQLNNTLQFSGVTEARDFVENLVLDYNVAIWLAKEGYYDANKLKVMDSAPIFTAIRESELLMSNTENRILKKILSVRIK